MNHLWSPGQQRRCRGLPVRRPVATSAAAAAFETAPFAAYLAATLLAVTIILALATGTAHAAIGIGTSPAATVDTVRPVLNLDALPEHLLVAGGQNVTFHWTSSDDHPGTTAADFTAQVRDGATPLAAIDYLATADDTTWDYQVPDISSGYLSVVVTCRDAFGNTTTAQSAEFSVVLSTSDVPVAGLPDRPVLEGNQPNPCNPGTTVRFSLPEAQTAVLELYAANGARVRRLVDGGFEAGQHEVFWDGRDDHGRAVASGTYLLRLTAGNVQQARKLALVR